MKTLYDETLEQPPPADRLRAMIGALADGAEIDAAMRTEIIDALKRHEIRRRNDELRATNHRPVAFHTFNAAAIARRLVDEYGVKPTYAARAAAKEYRLQYGLSNEALTDGATEREYRKIKDSPDYSKTLENGDKIQVALIDERLIAGALDRVPKSAIRGKK